jgi:hypothetical protein
VNNFSEQHRFETSEYSRSLALTWTITRFKSAFRKIIHSFRNRISSNKTSKSKSPGLYFPNDDVLSHYDEVLVSSRWLENLKNSLWTLFYLNISVYPTVFDNLLQFELSSLKFIFRIKFIRNKECFLIVWYFSVIPVPLKVM